MAQRLFYITNSRIPTEKAYGLETMKICEALTAFFEIKLIAPKRFNEKNPFEYYDIKKKFVVKKLPSFYGFVLKNFGFIGFTIETLFFSFIYFLYVLFKTNNEDLFFSHDIMPLFFASFGRKKIYYDLHDFPVKWLFFYRLFFKRVSGIISTNQWKKNKLVEIFKISPEKIIVFPNGVDIQEFDININKNEARNKLGLPNNKKIILYTGHLFKWKGADTLIEAGKFFGEDVLIYLVGGTDQDIELYKIKTAGYKNVALVGRKPHAEIPLWLKAADILVLPNTAKEEISLYWTSPMKLFEYMASERPIVASDLPSIREIADENEIAFAKPDDAGSLAEAIKKILNNEELGKSLAKNAKEKVKNFTWRKRAEKIKEFILKN